LGRHVWKGETWYRVLSYYFSIRWTWEAGGGYARAVLERFEVQPDESEERNPPTPGLPARYALITRGRGHERRFELYFGEHLMFASPEPGNVLDLLFWNINAEAIRATGDFLLIHAGAVTASDGVGVLLLGESGSGKTTLTGALVRAGFGYLSDDAAPIDPVSKRLYPYPKALSIKLGAGDLFPERSAIDGEGLLKSQRYLLPEDLRPGCVAGPCRIGHVIVHRWDPSAATTIERISPAAGVVELSRNGLNIPRYGERALAVMTDVARGAEHHTLVAGSLDDAVRAIERVTRPDRSA
jgi:hypothetical protein